MSAESIKSHILESVVESSPDVTRYIQNSFLLGCLDYLACVRWDRS